MVTVVTQFQHDVIPHRWIVNCIRVLEVPLALSRSPTSIGPRMEVSRVPVGSCVLGRNDWQPWLRRRPSSVRNCRTVGIWYDWGQLGWRLLYWMNCCYVWETEFGAGLDQGTLSVRHTLKELAWEQKGSFPLFMTLAMQRFSQGQGTN